VIAQALAAFALLANVDLPQGEVRYRIELGGVHMGFARLAVRCGAERCDVAWESALAAPEPGAGEAVRRRVDVEADRDGSARSVRFWTREEGRERTKEGGPGPPPASLAEALVGRAADGERLCVKVRDEETGRVGDACGRREGAWVEAEVLRERVRFRAAPGALPEEVVLPEQGARFVADARAALPAAPPRLFGISVRGPPSGSRGRSFCLRGPTPLPAASAAALPRRFPPGASCRERAARYVDLVRAGGGRARNAVGVAFDGREFVWHAWAEVWDGARWIPVDPAFEEAPARSRRFTVARYEDGDDAARASAARDVLDCWQAGARVE
jgi:hypothetical protein